MVFDMVKIRLPYVVLILLCCYVVTSCTSTTQPLVKNLNQLIEVASYQIKVTDPSGLTLGKEKLSLWTVSDKKSEIYNISLTGEVLNTIPLNAKDLEGITYDSKTDSFWLVEEVVKNAINVSTTGKELSRHLIDIDAKDPNSGLEAICIGKSGDIFMLNEKLPMTFLHFDQHLKLKFKQSMSISEDLSGIAYDDKREAFWIVSDKSKTLMQWSPSQGVIARYSLPYTKAEGVTIDTDKDLIYVVSDLTEKLYVYQLM